MIYKIGVLMTTYNEEKYIHKCIESILNQTYRDFRLFIVDDDSTDNTSRIIKEYAKSDERIELIETGENIGFCRSLNVGLKKIQADYVARIDADDICLDFRFAKEVEFLDKHPEISAVGSSMLVHDDGGIWGFVEAVNDFSIDFALERVPLFHPTVMMRKKVIDAIGGYTVWQKKTRCSEDYDLWLKWLSAGYKISNLKIPTIMYREDEISYRKRDKAQQHFFSELQNSWFGNLGKSRSCSSKIKDCCRNYLPQSLFIMRHRRMLRDALKNNLDWLKSEGINV